MHALADYCNVRKSGVRPGPPQPSLRHGLTLPPRPSGPCSPAKFMMPLRFTRPSNKGILIAGMWGGEEGRGECFSMITTEPTVAIGAIHDRMPAVLAEDQLRPYLEGELREFGPSRVLLNWVPTENFLTKKKKEETHPPAEPPPQGELFKD
jgi:putative SOS response-associated peptidase YedK